MATDQGQTEIRKYPKKSKPTSKEQIYIFALNQFKEVQWNPAVWTPAEYKHPYN